VLNDLSGIENPAPEEPDDAEEVTEETGDAE